MRTRREARSQEINVQTWSISSVPRSTDINAPFDLFLLLCLEKIPSVNNDKPETMPDVIEPHQHPKERDPGELRVTVHTR